MGVGREKSLWQEECEELAAQTEEEDPEAYTHWVRDWQLLGRDEEGTSQKGKARKEEQLAASQPAGTHYLHTTIVFTVAVPRYLLARKTRSRRRDGQAGTLHSMGHTTCRHVHMYPGTESLAGPFAEALVNNADGEGERGRSKYLLVWVLEDTVEDGGEENWSRPQPAEKQAPASRWAGGDEVTHEPCGEGVRRI